MREKPIIFSAPMVLALLSGQKTQTRRAIKPQPTHFNPAGVPRRVVPAGGASDVIRCPHGAPGGRLWVREAFRLCAEADAIPPRDTDASYRVWYEADEPHQHGFGKLRPSMFMPRWASRITLEVVSVRVERLQDISEADAMAEGGGRCRGQVRRDGSRLRQSLQRSVGVDQRRRQLGRQPMGLGHRVSEDQGMSNLQTRARRCADALEAGHVGVSGVQATLRECADHIEVLHRDADHYRTQWERLSERHTALAEALRLRQIEVDRLLMLVRSQERAL